MPFHTGWRHHAIIGEAALSLVLRREEIGVTSLLKQLGVMQEEETSLVRATQIVQAIDFLKSFMNVSSRDSTAAGQRTSGMGLLAGDMTGDAIQLDKEDY